MALGANFDVTAILKANVKDFTSGLKEAQTSLESLKSVSGSGLDKVSQSLSAVSGAMMKVGAGMTAGFTVPVVGAIGGVVKSFAELEQNIGGTEAVFGQFASSVQADAKTAYKNMGLSASDYMATANKMGSLFQGSGIEQRRALDLTSQAMQRASDVASVMGIDMKMAMESVAGAAKGNFTMMDNLGVAMNATTLEAYALEKGINFKWDTASNAQKAELAMAMFMDRTSQYAGNFRREVDDTVAGSFDAMKGAFQNLTAGLGQKDADMKQLLGNMAETIKVFVKNVKGVVKNIWDNLPLAPWQKWLGAVVVATGPTLMALSGLVGAVAKVVGFASGAYKAFVALKAGFVAAQTGGAAVSGVFGTLGGIIGGITAPVWAVIAAVAVLVAGFVLLYKHNDEFRAKVNEAWAVIKQTISTAVSAVVTFVKGLWGQMVSWWNENQELIRQTAETVWNAIKTIIETVMTVLEPIITTAWNVIVSVVQTAWEWIKTYVQTGLDVVLGIIKAVMQMINGDWSGAWETLKGVAATVWEGIKSLVQIALDGLWQLIQIGLDFLKGIWETAWNGISGFLSGIWSAISQTVIGFLQPIIDFIGNALSTIKANWELVWDSIKTFFASLLLVIVGLVTGNFDLVKEAISKAWERIKANTEQIWENIKTLLSNAWNAVKSIVSSAVENVKNFISNGWNTVVSTVTSAGPRIVEAVRNGFNNAVNAARNFVGQAVSAGGDLISGFVNGVVGAAGRLISAVSNAVGNAISAAKNLLGIKSPSRVFRQFGLYTDQGFVIGINSGAGKVVKSMAGMAQGAISAFAGQDVAGSLMGELGDVDGELGRLSAYDPSVSFNGGSLTVSQQAANIVLNMGGTVYRAFTNDIREAQELELILDNY